MSVNTQNAGTLTTYDGPDRCPVCLHAIYPIDTGQGWFGTNGLETIFRCPRQQCSRFFVARYQQIKREDGSMIFRVVELLPLTVKVSEHAEIIRKVSPDFAAIYAEAEKAEQTGLKLVCGPGYRKALEFLIKDYVIRSHADKAEEIKRLNLAKCITEYVSDGKVKQVAARAVWLGNDETHYLRKWEDKDLSDLKGLIKLTLHWIEMDEITQQVLADMPEGK